VLGFIKNAANKTKETLEIIKEAKKGIPSKDIFDEGEKLTIADAYRAVSEADKFP